MQVALYLAQRTLEWLFITSHMAPLHETKHDPMVVGHNHWIVFRLVKGGHGKTGIAHDYSIYCILKVFHLIFVKLSHPLFWELGPLPVRDTTCQA